MTSFQLLMHETYCKKNIKKCDICGDKVILEDYDEHHKALHSKVDCVHCGKKFERDFLEKHYDVCSEKKYQCKYCALDMQIYDLVEHEYICGSKTELCELCSNFVAIKDFDTHLSFGCYMSTNNIHNEDDEDVNRVFDQKVIEEGKQRKEPSALSKMFKDAENEMRRELQELDNNILSSGSDSENNKKIINKVVKKPVVVKKSYLKSSSLFQNKTENKEDKEKRRVEAGCKVENENYDDDEDSDYVVPKKAKGKGTKLGKNKKKTK